MEKIAFVCQRYGLEVNGGAELYCRQLAEKLSNIYEVHVYTTCAIDYVTWKNEYKEGIEEINNVIVHRFLVKEERETKKFNKISDYVFNNANHSNADEEKWLIEQGPVAIEALETLYKEQNNYKVVIFMTYLYYLTAKGITMGFNNAILIPTVHDEPPVYLKYYDKVFNSAKAFIWNTYEEKEFAEKRFPKIKNTKGIIAGVGVDIPNVEQEEIPDKLKGKDYVIYVGRIDESKGCSEMFTSFISYKNKHIQSDLKLVLIGKAVMDIPNHKDIIHLGFVSNELKFTLIKNAKALVLFSRYESLSMVVLESMAMGIPVLVNGKCDVLKGHCIRSDAGLYFENELEFEKILDFLWQNQDIYNKMGHNGIVYVNKYYKWDIIINKIKDLISNI